MSTLQATNLKHASSTDSNIELKSNGGVGNLLVSNPGAISYIEVGHGQTGDHSAYVDFASNSTYTDYALRVLRSGGANSSSNIYHRGQGNLVLKAEDANGQVVIENFAPQIPQVFVSFNGGATGSLHSSYNVSSVTDNGTGNYTVNFTNNVIKRDHTNQSLPAVIAQSHGPVNSGHCLPFPGDYQDGQVSIGLFNVSNSNTRADGNPVTVAVWG